MDDLMVPRITDDIVVQDIEGDVLLFDGETLTLLQGSSARVATALDGVRSAGQLLHDLAAGEEVALADLEKPFHEALAQLLDGGVAEMVPAPTEPVLRPPPYVGFCRDGDSVVLLDLRTGDRHALDPVGSLVWELLIAHGRLARVFEELREVYGGGEDVQQDVERLVVALVDLGLMVQTGYTE